MLTSMENDAEMRRSAIVKPEQKKKLYRSVSLSGDLDVGKASLHNESGLKVVKLPAKVTVVDDPLVIFLQSCDAGLSLQRPIYFAPKS